jgi:quinol monooxygenase YgiN
MPVLVATITPKPGKMAAAEAVIKEAIPTARIQPGCERYSLHRGKGFYLIIEKWHDADSLRAWAKTPALKELHDNLVDLVETLEGNYVVVEQIPVGDPAKEL